ncbi:MULTISPECIES: hypothetical protein [unclassified Streptomyces]|uniref:hypothetical protein n=1 Tax=unclassified Streptomyces TaxID=2593676 RepID=UPI000B0D200E|nr:MULTISPECIES: hypothetical protein [unclassified Streptomyces]
MTDRDERVSLYAEQDRWTQAERIVDLEDGIKAFMELDNARLKQIEKLKDDLNCMTLERDALWEKVNGSWM